MIDIKLCIKEQALLASLEIHEQRKVKVLLESLVAHLADTSQQGQIPSSHIQPVGNVWVYAFVAQNITHYGIAESRSEANGKVNHSFNISGGSITRIGKLN